MCYVLELQDIGHNVLCVGILPSDIYILQDIGYTARV